MDCTIIKRKFNELQSAYCNDLKAGLGVVSLNSMLLVPIAFLMTGFGVIFVQRTQNDVPRYVPPPSPGISDRPFLSKKADLSIKFGQ